MYSQERQGSVSTGYVDMEVRHQYQLTNIFYKIYTVYCGHMQLPHQVGWCWCTCVCMVPEYNTDSIAAWILYAMYSLHHQSIVLINTYTKYIHVTL